MKFNPRGDSNAVIAALKHIDDVIFEFDTFEPEYERSIDSGLIISKHRYIITGSKTYDSLKELNTFLEQIQKDIQLALPELSLDKTYISRIEEETVLWFGRSTFTEVHGKVEDTRVYYDKRGMWQQRKQPTQPTYVAHEINLLPFKELVALAKTDISYAKSIMLRELRQKDLKAPKT